MDKPLVRIEYKTTEGKRICLEVSIAVKDLLEQTDRRFRSQGRQERRHHTEYADGLTDTTTIFPQEDFADLVERIDNYKRLYAAIENLSEIQRRRLHLHYFRGLSYREIADAEKVNYKSVVRSVAQARSNIRKSLSE